MVASEHSTFFCGQVTLEHRCGVLVTATTQASVSEPPVLTAATLDSTGQRDREPTKQLSKQCEMTMWLWARGAW
jgi:hypothetical protein